MVDRLLPVQEEGDSPILIYVEFLYNAERGTTWRYLRRGVWAWKFRSDGPLSVREEPSADLSIRYLALHHCKKRAVLLPLYPCTFTHG